MSLNVRSYELTKLPNYDALIEALDHQSLLHTQVNGVEQFYMPDRKISIDVRRGSNGQTFLDVRSTGFREPAYVRKLVERLGGRSASGYSFSGAPTIVEVLSVLEKS